MRTKGLIVAAAMLASAISLSAGTAQADTGQISGDVQLDVTYCRADDVDLKMDIYPPQQKTLAPAPAIVYVHGGSWAGGDKDEPRITGSLAELSKQGFLLVSVNYRLYPDAVFPAQIEDVKCAVRYLRANAAALNIDPDHIGAWGASAGGHLAALLGTTDDNDGLEGTSGYSEFSSRVQAVVDWFGPTDLLNIGSSEHSGVKLSAIFGRTKEDLRRASPVTYVTKDDPPFLIVQGNRDPVVPMSQSQELYDKLVAVNVHAELVIVQNAGHLFVPLTGPIKPSLGKIFDQVPDFFTRMLKPAAGS